MTTEQKYNILNEICQARKSTRDFLDRPVPPELVEKISEIALTSPYASNKKNWEITKVDDRAVIAAIAGTVEAHVLVLLEQIRADLKNDFMAYAAHFSAFKSAPLLLILTFRSAPSLSLMLSDSNDKILRWEQETYAKSIACVAMLILLAAESLGLGSCFMTGPLLAEEEIGKIIKIKPGRSLGAVIPVGYKLNQ
jgi:nitroreductase